MVNWPEDLEDGTEYYRRRKQEDRNDRREQKALRRLDKQMARRRNKEDDRYEFLRRKLSFEDQRRMGKFDWLITSVAIAGIAYFLGHLAAWVVR